MALKPELIKVLLSKLKLDLPYWNFLIQLLITLNWKSSEIEIVWYLKIFSAWYFTSSRPQNEIRETCLHCIKTCLNKIIFVRRCPLLKAVHSNIVSLLESSFFPRSIYLRFFLFISWLTNVVRKQRQTGSILTQNIHKG